MHTVESILADLRAHPHCQVLPPQGMPVTPSGYSLPDDLQTFYRLAGGAVVRANHKLALPIRILAPGEFQRIDAAITGEMFASGPFEHWFAMAYVGDLNYVSIDLHPSHLGFCYDSFHETFAMPGYVKVVARSFSDFLARVLRHTDDSTYWLQDGSEDLGEAFATYGYKSISS